MSLLTNLLTYLQEQEQYRGLQTVLKKCLKLLKALARGNDLVQMRIFERLDNLLKIKVVEVDLAVALREVRRARNASEEKYSEKPKNLEEETLKYALPKGLLFFLAKVKRFIIIVAMVTFSVVFQLAFGSEICNSYLS